MKLKHSRWIRYVQGNYHVTFLSRHPANKHLCDDFTRWWHERHDYYLDDSNIQVYGTCMLFNPRRNLDLTKYILWTDSVHLTDTSCFLRGPFNFDSQSDIIFANQFIFYVIRSSSSLLVMN